MNREPSVWATIFLAIATALALTFLLSGCASSDPEAVAGDRWGTCDHSRLDRIILICRQSRAEPVSESSPVSDLSH